MNIAHVLAFLESYKDEARGWLCNVNQTISVDFIDYFTNKYFFGHHVLLAMNILQEPH